VIVEPQHSEPSPFEKPCPLLVLFDPIRLQMLAAIDLDYQLQLFAAEIQDVWPDLLAAKLRTSELTRTEEAPDEGFGVGRVRP